MYISPLPEERFMDKIIEINQKLIRRFADFKIWVSIAMELLSLRRSVTTSVPAAAIPATTPQNKERQTGNYFGVTI